MAGKIIIPQAVYQEIVVKGKAGADAILVSDWIETKAIKTKEEIEKLPQHLGRGEKEATILAKELDGLLLIDDPSGRKEAERQGVKFTGILGTLQEAQAKGLRAYPKTL